MHSLPMPTQTQSPLTSRYRHCEYPPANSYQIEKITDTRQLLDCPINTAAVYVWPEADTTHRHAWLARLESFVESYLTAPPGRTEPDLFIISNGGNPCTEAASLIELLPNPTVISRDNSGYDLGAFKHWTDMHGHKYDIAVYMGTYARPTKPGWMDFIKIHFLLNGPGLYGQFFAIAPYPHIRTQVFISDPLLISMFWPKYVLTSQRYPLEHGPNNWTIQLIRAGFDAFVLSWDGIWHVRQLNTTLRARFNQLFYDKFYTVPVQ
ncbi:MAG: hypothetical protein NZ739_08165 [Verrucomicrobiae bacterium]|nr:hypothetical protein [Verrucomicrobiae bacterium]